ncbi:hypothetical protein J5N97_021697 [Dioscorea zingiberensis]|uniref:Amidase domain-containing protein n=1 Tax=Dioscorea zingiberensis TaxID=325984 RepID=A0A9D5HA60_9LILI|nr:hypothetical protein J5N97_021697 [Dioscorea zingiberensis]
MMGQRKMLVWSFSVIWFGLSYLFELCYTVGHDKEGLPIGLQLIGRPWGEATILRVASAIEELCSRTRKRPSTFYDILSSVEVIK